VDTRCMFVENDSMSTEPPSLAISQVYTKEDGTWRKITRVRHKKSHDYWLVSWLSPKGLLESSEREFVRWAETATLQQENK